MKLDISGLKKFQAEMQSKLTSKEVQAGLLPDGETAVSPSIITKGKTLEKIITYATANEYGTDHIPPRPFMRRAFDNGMQEWEKKALEMIAQGVPTEGALRICGLMMRDTIVGSIHGAFGAWKANDPNTIKRKTRVSLEGGNKVGDMAPPPLIDTGDMVRSIGFKVTDLDEQKD